LAIEVPLSEDKLDGKVEVVDRVNMFPNSVGEVGCDVGEGAVIGELGEGDESKIGRRGASRASS
jgi:hypothetical protein